MTQFIVESFLSSRFAVVPQHMAHVSAAVPRRQWWPVTSAREATSPRGSFSATATVHTAVGEAIECAHGPVVLTAGHRRDYRVLDPQKKCHRRRGCQVVCPPRSQAAGGGHHQQPGTSGDNLAFSLPSSLFTVDIVTQRQM